MVQFSYIFTSSITQAMQILLGRYLGARNVKCAEKLITKTLLIATTSSICISIIQAIFAGVIFTFFTITLFKMFIIFN